MMTVDFLPTVERLTTFEQFCAVEQEWNNLAVEQVKTIFMTHGWLKEWWQIFGAQYQIWPLLARTNGKLVGVLPLMLSREKYGVRVLKFMGGNEVTPNHLDIITAPQHRSEVIRAFLSMITRTCRKDWDVLELNKIPGDSPSLERLKNHLEMEGFHVAMNRTAICPYAELPDSFEEFLQTRSAKTQEGFRYAKRRVAREYPEHRLGPAESLEDVDVLMLRLIELHQKRWTQKGYTGSFGSQHYVDFHLRVARQAFLNHQLRLYSLRLNGDIVAVIYCYRVADMVQYYLGGFEESWSKYSPGNIVNLFAIEQAISEGASRFDFLEGDEPYKQQWMTNSLDNFAVTAFRSNIRGNLFRFRQAAGNNIIEIGTRLLPQKIRRPLWQLYLRSSSRRKENRSRVIKP